MATKAEELRILAQEIKNETQVGANTAERVGTAFEQAANGLDELLQNVGGVHNSLLDTQKELQEELNRAVESITPIEITGNVTNAPDEEDLTSVNVDGTDVLKFKDKAYAPMTYSGLGRKYLRKNIVDGVNILTQSMINEANTIYIIQYDFTLGEDIAIPADCILDFNGGSFKGGYTLTFNHTQILNTKELSIICSCQGTIDSITSLYLSHFIDTANITNGKLQGFVNFAYNNNCEIIIDKSFETSENIVIYPGTDSLGDKPGPKIRGINNPSISFKGTGDFIKIYPYANPLDTNHRAFYNKGYIKNIKFVANPDNGVVDSILSIRGWWNFDITDIYINDETTTATSPIKVKNGIIFPTYTDNGTWINPDYYASATGRITGCQIRGCEIGIYDQVENGVPYLTIKNCIIDYNKIGIKCLSSCWTISSGSISWNNEYGVMLGDTESNYICNKIIIELIEFDGNGYYKDGSTIYMVGSLHSIIRSCNCVTRYVDGNIAGNKNFIELSAANKTIRQNTIENNRFIVADPDYSIHYCIIYSKITNMTGAWIDNTVKNNIMLNGTDKQIIDGLNVNFYKKFFNPNFTNILITQNVIVKGVHTQYIYTNINNNITTDLNLNDYVNIIPIMSSNIITIENNNTFVMPYSGRYKISLLGQFYDFTNAITITVLIYINGTATYRTEFVISKPDVFCGMELPITLQEDNSKISIGLASTGNAQKRQTFTCEVTQIY